MYGLCKTTMKYVVFAALIVCFAFCIGASAIAAESYVVENPDGTQDLVTIQTEVTERIYTSDESNATHIYGNSENSAVILESEEEMVDMGLLPESISEPVLDTQASKDLLLGMFFTSENNWTNSLWTSWDGKTFTRIGTAFRQQRSSDHTFASANGERHYPLHDPSIIWRDGYFWALSGCNLNDGKFWPIISYSKDLVRWTYPEGDFNIKGTRGISLDVYPTSFGKINKRFDTVAPEWVEAADGSLWIMFSAGYFGAFHNNAMKDDMTAYIVKVNKLSAKDGYPDGKSKSKPNGTTGYDWPVELVFETSKAKQLPFTTSADYIDGSIHAEGGINYLTIKRSGLTNETWATNNLNDVHSWRQLNSKATWGYEGASVERLGPSLFMAADGVVGTKPVGVNIFSARSIYGPWSKQNIVWQTKTGVKVAAPRHGSITRLSAGSPAWKAALKLLQSSDRKVSAQAVYRLYNPNSGEHFYTCGVYERDRVADLGWKYEGVAWKQASSGTKVYRLYNPNAGDHLYTVNKNEVTRLRRLGWRYEGIGFISSNNHTKPVYRLYNPRAKTGTHFWTSNASEKNHLIRIGWRYEGIGWYAA